MTPGEDNAVSHGQPLAEPTEREKQIALEAADQFKENHGLRESFIGNDLYRAFLAAVTAANQQRNEENARLRDWIRELFCPNGCFDGAYPTQPDGEPEQCQFCFERNMLLAARGVQPAAKHPWIAGMSNEEVRRRHFPAAKEEGAPAAEQIAQAAANLVKTYDEQSNDHDPRNPDSGDKFWEEFNQFCKLVRSAPSPAQEKPVEAVASALVLRCLDYFEVTANSLRVMDDSAFAASMMEFSEDIRAKLFASSPSVT